MNTNNITLNHVKLQAKKLKKQLNITHAQALDVVAKNKGYSNWMHCCRLLSKEEISAENAETSEVEHVSLSFSDWLKRQINRDSPLGDLAKDVERDSEWPLYGELQNYEGYLHTKHASLGAFNALRRAFKSYHAYLKRISTVTSPKPAIKRLIDQKNDQRKITIVPHVKPLHYEARTIEKFNPGDPAWISWDGRKAIPVTVLNVDDKNYLLRIERPIKRAGNQHWLFLDEVRSSPELACINRVTS